MKILFIARATIFTNRGGDTIQLVNTTRHLSYLGVLTEIKLGNEKIDYTSYDLIHFFNIIRPADILKHIKASGKPYVVSTIYVDYSEFDKKARKGFSGLLFKMLPANLVEYAKVIARAAMNGERIVSPEYLWLGQYKAIRKIIQGAAMLLPNSQNEYKRLFNSFGIMQKYQVIPNAIDAALFQNTGIAANRDPQMILCVGRIEGLKNQLNLIKAINNTNYQLYLIGAAATNQNGYYQLCRDQAAANIHFLDSMDQAELIKYYATAKVHVLPSWFETTGLSSLEAAAMGCNVVITDKGDTREYFEDMAYYCDPASPESIKQAIEKAANAPFNEILRTKILNEYTWPVTAAKTLEAYQMALSK